MKKRLALISPNTIEPVAVEQKPLATIVAEILKSRYQGYQTIQGLFGEPLQLEEQYINFQMIYTSQTSEKKEFASKKEKEGGSKRVLKLEELFKEEKVFEEDLEHSLLFIQGRAGIGKTTCIHYIANAWANQKLWPQYEWIFCLTFRELRASGFQAAAEKRESFALWEWIYESLIKESLLSKTDFQKIWQAVIELEIKAGNGLFILDGADEAPTLHPCGEVLTALFVGEYQSCPKIVTSRPDHGLGYLPTKRRNVEIIGFTHENVTHYVQQYFSSNNNNNTSSGETLLTLLKPNISLWSNAHIPVTLNLICGIYEKGQKDRNKSLKGLTTMTGLYERMVEALMERAYLNEHNTQEQQNPLLLKEGIVCQDLTPKQRRAHIQEYYQEALAFLGELAFKGLQQEAIILPVALVNEFRDELDPQVFIKAKQLGLIKPLLEEPLSEEVGCEFLHLTFQELFAARHIVAQVKNKDKKAYIAQFIREQKYNPRYQIVWWFVAGLLKPKALKTKEPLPEIEKEAFQGYLNLLQEPTSQDLLRQYELGLLVRVVEESYSLATDPLLEPILNRLRQAFLSLYRLHQRSLEGGWRIRFPLKSPLENGLPPLINMLKLSPIILQLKDKQAITALLPLPKEGVKDIKDQLGFLEVIGITTPSILTYVRTQLTDRNYRVRRRAVHALKGMGVVATTFQLGFLLEDKDEEIRKSAIHAVERMGAAAATPEILKPLCILLRDKDEDKDVRMMATETVRKIGTTTATPDILRALRVLLADKNEDVRIGAARAVGIIELKKFLDTLSWGVGTMFKNWRAQTSAIRAVKTIGYVPTTHATLDILKDERVRESAARTVQEIGTVAEMPDILKLGIRLADKDKDVCNKASLSLQILAKQDFIRLYQVWHSLSQVKDKDKLAEAIPCLAAITIGGYLAGTAQMQVLWVDNAYQLQIYIGPHFLKEPLTLQQAQILRHLMPLIINRFEKQGQLMVEELMDIVKQLPEPSQDLKPPELKALSKPSSGKEEVPLAPHLTGNLLDCWSIDYKELKFEEGGELGKGSYGIVYKGTYRNNPVAIKRLQLISPSSEAIQEFTTEMKIMFKLRCPQIITLYGIYLTPSYGIVMEFMPKKSLFEVLKNKEQPFEWSIRYPIAVDIVKGVAYLHKEGVLHRDLKSLNVLVNEHWKAKLTDFGISELQDKTKGLSSNKGSLLWIAPERLRGEKHTGKSDVYSLGMTLSELASRELPFKEARGDKEKIKQLILDGKHDPIPSDCPPKIKNVIQLCWLMNAKKRPTAEEVLEKLQAPDIEELSNDPGTNKLNTGSRLSLTNKN